MPFPLLELVDVEPDIIYNILSCLGKEDRRLLLQCRLVCRQLNQMIFTPKMAFMWERMALTQKIRDESAESKEKARSFLSFLHNVAPYVVDLKFLAGARPPTTNLQSLPDLPALRTLDLSGTFFLTDSDLGLFSAKCNPVEVNLRRCARLNDAALVAMSTNWTRIESIDLSYCYCIKYDPPDPDTDDSDTEDDDSDHLIFQNIATFHDSLTMLKKYNIEGLRWSSPTMSHLLNRDGVTERLTELRLSAANLTDAIFTSIGNCTSLVFFAVQNGINITDAVLIPLKNLTALKHLHLEGGCDFTAEALVDFFKTAHFTLQYLRLNSWRALNDTAMEHVLLRNPGLRSLNIDWCQNVSDTGLRHVRGLSQLRLLTCNRTERINGEFLNFDPGRLPELRYVGFMDSRVAETTRLEICKRFGLLDLDWSDGPKWHDSEWLKQRALLEGIDGRCCITLPMDYKVYF